MSNTGKVVWFEKKRDGIVIVPPTEVPNVGRFAVLTDTLGAAIGILQLSA